MKNIFITFQSLISRNLLDMFPCITKNYEWIDINSVTSYKCVGNLLHTLIEYNDILDTEKVSTGIVIDRLIEKMNCCELIAPGGLHFIGENQAHIYPGCCSGLEEWTTMVSELMNGESPWMGHDPFVNLKEENGLCLITTKSEMNTYTFEYYEDIYYSKSEFLMLLSKLEDDFDSFVKDPLKAYIKSISDKYADDFLNAFSRCFKRI